MLADFSNFVSLLFYCAGLAMNLWCISVMLDLAKSKSTKVPAFLGLILFMGFIITFAIYNATHCWHYYQLL